MLYRFNIQLAIPEAVYNKIPADKKLAFRDQIRAMKALAVKINAGLPSEEMTIKATWHKCYHDAGEQSCEPEQDI